MHELQDDETNGEDSDGGWLGNAGEGASVLDEIAVPGGAFGVGKIVPAEKALEMGMVLTAGEQHLEVVGLVVVTAVGDADHLVLAVALAVWAAALASRSAP